MVNHILLMGFSAEKPKKEWALKADRRNEMPKQPTARAWFVSNTVVVVLRMRFKSEISRWSSWY